MTITIHPIPLNSKHHPSYVSPKSVMHREQSENLVEHFVLDRSECRVQQTDVLDMQIHSNEDGSRSGKHKRNDSKNSAQIGKANIHPKRPKPNSAWICPVSKKCKHTINPVQSMVGQVASRIRPAARRADCKSPLSLASGDAIAVGSMPPCMAAIEVLVKATLETSHAAAYSNACGTLEARRAIAKAHSYSEVQINPDDVIVTNGCSGALDLALNCLLDEGSTILVPQPGFPLYEEIAKSIGATVAHYHLDPKKSWECDMDHLESIMESHSEVRAIVINNPSSVGAVWNEAHLATIIDFATRYQLPIVSDEIYGDLTFGANTFTPLARVAAREGCHVPIITASGISKQFLLPGWRAGWLTFHDNKFKSLTNVKIGASRLAQLLHGSSNLSQAVIPTLLDPQTPGLRDWKDTLRVTLQSRSQFLGRRLGRCPGLNVITSQGAMFATIEIDAEKLGFEHDLEFAMRLVDEENVFVVPGMSMGVQNIIRVSFCQPENILAVAACRIESFCRRHFKPSMTNASVPM